MKRSGGRASSPVGTWSIDQLENHVAANKHHSDELQLVLAQLGYRWMNRAIELKDILARLIDNKPQALPMRDKE